VKFEQFSRFSIFFSPSSGFGLEKWGPLKSRSDRPDSAGSLVCVIAAVNRVEDETRGGLVLPLRTDPFSVSYCRVVMVCSLW